MTDQQGPYDPYATQWPQQGQPGQQGGPGRPGYDPMDDTQQWQGQTWETTVQPSLQMPSPAEETAYLPPQQSYDGPPDAGYAAAAEPPSPYAWQQPAQGAPTGGYAGGGAPGQSGGYAREGAAAAGAAGYAPGAHAGAAAGPYASAGAAGAAGTAGAAAGPYAPAGHPDASSGGFVPGGAQAGPYASGAGAGGFAAGGAQAGAYAPAGQGVSAAGPVASPAGPSAPSAGAAGSGVGQGAPSFGGGETSAASSQGGGPGYGPATLAGNARVTDAQRARLEGRSPIIEPGMQPAALTALLGLLLAGTAPFGMYGLLLPLVALQGVTAAGWFRLNGMWPARQGIALAFLGALVSDAVLLGVGQEHAPAAILGTLGVWVLLCLILQLRSHADPDERMYGLMATVASSALAIVATGYLGADSDAVSVGAAAVAVAIFARALPLPTPASVVVSLLAAAGAGIAVGGMNDVGAPGALVGAGAAACALIGHRVASYDYPSRFVHFTAGVALPLSLAAPAVYVLGRALG
ncbi:hypothetical protein IAG44_19250 [Streptomyces roseirectus]|uniref:Uncharacterized protein n=1 Tax=Streptomyces roseirectus TaxID=2768066 RepID=A0A7H0IEZ3_9ACTN|nr:hypothetical protein [Streptomyces roseirectus]QNP71359.1 hypothetical protein IAG44_19250 [Streptomyces roseirectus]